MRKSVTLALLLSAGFTGIGSVSIGQAIADPAANPGYHSVGTIPLPDGGLTGAALDPDRRQIVIGQGNGVSALDLDLQRVKTGWLAGQSISAVAAPSSFGPDAATDEKAGATILFDGTSGKPTATLKTGGKPVAAFFEPKSGLLVVANGTSNAVFIDPAKRTITGKVVLNGPAAPQIAGDGVGLAYVGRADGSEVMALDTGSQDIHTHLPLSGCQAMTGIGYAQDVRTLVVACGNGAIKLVSADGKELSSLTGTKGQGQVVYDQDRHWALIPGDGKLTVVAVADDGSGSVVQTVKLPAGIRTGAIDPVTGRVYLLAPASTPGGSHVLVLDPA